MAMAMAVARNPFLQQDPAMLDGTFSALYEHSSDLPCIQGTIAIILECRQQKKQQKKQKLKLKLKQKQNQKQEEEEEEEEQGRSCLPYAIRVHDHMVSNGSESIEPVKNHLVPLFVDCGSVSCAQQTFHSLHTRSEHSWTSLISAHAQMRSFFSFILLEQMERDGVQPSTHTFMHLLSFCARSSSSAAQFGRQIHSKIVKQGFHHHRHGVDDLPLTNALIAFYGACGFLADARIVFDRSPVRDLRLWNMLISLFVEQSSHEEAMLCLHAMESEGFSPDPTTFRHVLRACKSSDDFDTAKLFHHVLIARGCEMESLLVKSLVDLYASFGRFADAEAILAKASPTPDVDSWIVLMAKLSESAMNDRVLDCKEWLESAGGLLEPTVHIYALKACGELGDLGYGRELHSQMEKHHGFVAREPVVASALMSMYSKCGSISEAQHVFAAMSARDTVAWTVMLAAYSEHGLVEEALSTFRDMQASDVGLDSVAFACGLRACGAAKDIAKGKGVHAELVGEGFETSPVVGNALLEMYAKGGLLTEAWDVFDELSVRDVVAWNTLISACVGCELYQEALSFFDAMQNDEGIAPNGSTLVSILKACCYAGYGEEGLKLHAYILEAGFEDDELVGSVLLDMYCRCGFLDEARHLFDALPTRNAVIWSTLISGYTEHGLATEALMHSEQMQLEGVCADVTAVLCILRAYSSTGSTEKGRAVHSYIVKAGFEDDPMVGTALVHFYTRCAQFIEVEEVFSRLPARDVVSWTGLIAGFLDRGMTELALNCYDQMQHEGISPNAVTLLTIVKACGEIGALAVGREIHTNAAKEGLESDVPVCNALISMYAKCGAIEEAVDLFDELLLSRDVVSWSAVISGCVDQGDIDTAFSLYEGMQHQGVLPNEAAIMSLLKVCGNTGALEAGTRIDAQMNQVFAADIMFTTALIEMYAKCGCMVDAQALFDNIPRIDLVALNALSNGYARQGESNLVVTLSERMEEEGIKPNEATYLNLLTGFDHDGLVSKGQESFIYLWTANALSGKHSDCMVDILGRAGRLDEAFSLLQAIPLHTEGVSWINLLAACRRSADLELCERVFEEAVDVCKLHHPAAFVLMANMYAETDDAG